jgi:hypothetical protein
MFALILADLLFTNHPTVCIVAVWYTDIWYTDIWYTDIWYTNIWYTNIWYTNIWYTDIWYSNNISGSQVIPRNYGNLKVTNARHLSKPHIPLFGDPSIYA